MISLSRNDKQKRLMELLKTTHTESSDYSDQAKLHDEYITNTLLHNKVVPFWCLPGDTVYAVGIAGHDIKIVTCTVYSIKMTTEGLDIWLSFICDGNCNGCYFNQWHRDPTGEMKCSRPEYYCIQNNRDVGKYIFTSYEDAEAAAEALLKHNKEEWDEWSSLLEDAQ